jgi:hypothetical protein
MTAMQLTGSDFSQPQPSRSSVAAGRDSARIWPAGEPAVIPAPFQRLGSDILSETIPAFFIGRNKEGFWVARDVNGTIGGIFLFESSALAFAKRSSLPAACATIYPSERFELDLENRGNPLVGYLAPLTRLMTALAKRLTDIAGR